MELNKTRIEWCDYTWNCVIGCKNNCKLCYAKKINNRFHFIENWNNPEWKEKTFNKIFPKKASRIFVNSMSDICFWENSWMEKVLNKIKEYPQHQFLFLTKNPECYNNYWVYNNCWLGVTITSNDDFMYRDQNDKSFDFVLKESIEGSLPKVFYSIEPLIDRVDLDLHFTPDWVIIGADSTRNKNKIIPKLEWIEEIKEGCQKNNIPYFEKDNLKNIVKRKLIKEFPKWN